MLACCSSCTRLRFNVNCQFDAEGGFVTAVRGGNGGNVTIGCETHDTLGA